MTTVLRSGGPYQHRTKTNAITPIFVIDSGNQRLLHYDEMNPLQSDHYLSLDPAIANELSTDFEVRSDLIDAQIDICTPEVLTLWSESFDYELPRKNFLHGVLKDWELNGKMIYADVLQDGYAARASNLQMYDAISRDIMGRWTFPFIPENNLVPKQSYHRHASGLVMEDSVFLAQDARVLDSIIGRDTSIGTRSQVSNSVIGSGCTIGDDVVVEDSFIWDDVVVKNGATILHSILADSTCIGRNCSIPRGSLLSFRVQLSDNTALQKGVVLSTVSPDGQPATGATDLLGPSTNAAPFFDPDESDLDEEDPGRLHKSLLYSLANMSLSASSLSTLASEKSSEKEDDLRFLSADARAATRSRLSSFTSEDSTGKQSFHADAAHGLLDALRAGSTDFDSAKLEFMGLRLANDASDAMVRKAIATAFARHAAELLSPERGALEPSKAAERALTATRGAVKFVREVGLAGGKDEQVDFLLAMQKSLQHVSGTDLGKKGVLLVALLQQLYTLDVVDEEVILEWWEDERAVDNDGLITLRERCRVLIDWLETAEEDDDDEDD